MLKSLSSKITGVGILVTGALIALGALLVLSSDEMESGFRWIRHTQLVLEKTAQAVDLVRQAESEVRAAIIDGDAASVRDASGQLTRAAADLDQLVELTGDNPAQNDRARLLREALNKRISFLRSGVAGVQNGTLFSMPINMLRARNREAATLMAEVDERRSEMLAAEQKLFQARSERTIFMLRVNRLIVLVGLPSIILLIAGLKVLMIRAIRRPTRAMVSAMQTLDTADEGKRLNPAQIGSSEFAAIANGYNDLADRLTTSMARQREGEQQLQAANLQLQQRGEALEARSEVVERLALLSHRLSAVSTSDEFAKVTQCFAPQILPTYPGAIYAHNNSRNQLVRIAHWGGADMPERFDPTACWALRLGQRHLVANPDHDVSCGHHGLDAPCTCEPLLAGGEVIGLICLEGAVAVEHQFRLNALAGEISSAFVNHKLQRDLREQTIRDPLTGLFNRRFLEEALRTEVARAARGSAPLTVVMCDVDHFKRFNDEHGHEAGDAVLKDVAAEMLKHFRDGDLVCRFGGEEFTVIAPGATPEAITPRIERLRLAMGELRTRYGSAILPATSMSFGVARFHPSMTRDGLELIQMADEALYRAKREGRNRAVVAERLAA